MYQAAERYAVSLVSEGRLSIGKASELLDVTYYDIYHIAEKNGIELGSE
jgi:predicted HTH domain antitoxin